MWLTMLARYPDSRLGICQQPPNPQCLGYAPGLGDAPNGPVGRITLQDLRDTAQSCIAQVVLERTQHGQGGRAISMHAEMSFGVCAAEPRPDRPLVIGAIALHLVADVVAAVGRVVRAERP